ncbi:MAG: diguanylate cyclase domain-containing protein [Pseudomonadota bacterium]
MTRLPPPSHSHPLAWCLAWLAAAWLLWMPAGGARAEDSSETIRLHFHRESNDYLGWGLYVWGPGLELPRSVTWDRSLEPSGVDAFGVYFDVGVAPTATGFSFILHNGEAKSWPRDLMLDRLRDGREVWLVENSDTLHTSPPAIGVPFGLGAEADERRRETRQWIALGITAGVVLLALAAWAVQRRLQGARDELASHVELLVKAQGELREQGERLRSGVADELTGLPTRAGLQQALDHALARAQRQGHSLALLFIDLDGFKQVNDRGGHDAGDEVLRQVARRLKGVMRESDMLARVGGDEFVALIEAPGSAMQAFRIGRKLVRTAAEPVPFQGRDFQVGASIGLALFPEDGRDAASLTKAADSAMYEAKRQGKGACRFQQPERQAEAEQRLALEAGLRDAEAAGALQLRFEPVAELAGLAPRGQQVHLHWLQDGQAHAVQPLAEQSDDPALIARLDRWMLVQACRAAASWQAPAGQAAPWVGVALSASTTGAENLPALVRDVLAEEGLPPQRLTLKFPARLLADGHRQEHLLGVLVRLRSQGVHIALGGVGEQPIVLQRLMDAPVDQLVVDAPVAGQPGGLGSALVRALAALGAQGGFAVVAQGLATPAQLQWARAAGCSLGQGPAVGEEVPVESEAAEPA